MKTDTVVEIIEGLDWKVIKSLHIAGFYAEVPGGSVELIDGELRAYDKAGSPMWVTRNTSTKALHAELAESTGRREELDRELLKFLTGQDTLEE